MTSKKGLDALVVWQKSVDFAERLHRQVLPVLPNEEKWSLGQQLRRASQSIAANIAEGYGRYYYQEGIRFCYIARGSLEEVYSFLIFAERVNYLPEELLNELYQDIDEIRRLLSGYINYLKRNKRGENEPGAHYQIKEAIIEETYELEVDK
jgi:four helix bundle protein